LPPLRAKAAGAVKLKENNSITARAAQPLDAPRGDRPAYIRGNSLIFKTFEPGEADEIDQTGQVVNLLAMLKHCLAVVNP
jgi:hypothetical protein